MIIFEVIQSFEDYNKTVQRCKHHIQRPPLWNKKKRKLKQKKEQSMSDILLYLQATLVFTPLLLVRKSSGCLQAKGCTI